MFRAMTLAAALAFAATAAHAKDKFSGTLSIGLQTYTVKGKGADGAYKSKDDLGNVLKFSVTGKQLSGYYTNPKRGAATQVYGKQTKKSDGSAVFAGYTHTPEQPRGEFKIKITFSPVPGASAYVPEHLR